MYLHNGKCLSYMRIGKSVYQNFTVNGIHTYQLSMACNCYSMAEVNFTFIIIIIMHL